MSNPISGAFSAEERAVIDYWFENPATSPPAESVAGRFLASVGLTSEYFWAMSSCSAYIAQIALAAVEERLPQWGSVTQNTIMLGRDVRESAQRFSRSVQLRPKHLFEINWANSAPGISWPCAYYATFLPGYDRWVVTASSDSCDLWNVCDVTIGWFPHDESFLAGVHDVIVKEWRGPEGSQIDPWEDLWFTGAVSEELAYQWREEVWPDAVDSELSFHGRTVSQLRKKSIKLTVTPVDAQIVEFGKHARKKQ